MECISRSNDTKSFDFLYSYKRYKQRTTRLDLRIQGKIKQQVGFKFISLKSNVYSCEHVAINRR